MDRPFVVGTRYFETSTNEKQQMKSVGRLAEFIAGALESGAGQVLVALNIDEDESNVYEKWPLYGNMSEVVQLFPVTPWGKFAQPMNALLMKARDFFEREKVNPNVYPLFLSASVEVTLTKQIVATLVEHMDDDSTLVTGAVLEGHDYQPGTKESGASGTQVPWNTLAMWEPEYLMRTGFSLLGDGPLGQPEKAGVEEVSTIAMQQLIDSDMKAKLVEVPGVSRDIRAFSPGRLLAHQKKMESKRSRASAQLEAAGLKAPTVLHI